MNERAVPLGVIILALVAIALTSSYAYAQDASSAVSDKGAATHDGFAAPRTVKRTPSAPVDKKQFAGLPLRPSKPVSLNEEPVTSGWGYKLLACLAIVGGAMWLWKRRLLLKPPAEEHTLKILGRTPVGVRSELLIINVDGQKLLVGVTPQSIQRIAVLPDPHGDNSQLEAGATAPVETSDIEPGFEEFVTHAQQRFTSIPDRSATPQSPQAFSAREARTATAIDKDPETDSLVQLHPRKRKAR